MALAAFQPLAISIEERRERLRRTLCYALELATSNPQMGMLVNRGEVEARGLRKAQTDPPRFWIVETVTHEIMELMRQPELIAGDQHSEDSTLP